LGIEGMLQDYISLGDKLELKKLQTKADEENKTYISQLLDFVDHDKAFIAMPIVKGRVIPLTVGDRYDLYFYTSKGLYQCKAVITSRFKKLNVYYLEVQFLSELEKHQRRQYYRLECNIDMKYHIVTDAERILSNKVLLDKFESETDKQQCVNDLNELRDVWYNGTITDISGGGARFKSNNILEPGCRVRIELVLQTNEGLKKFVIPVKVISSNEILNHVGFYEHRVQYKDISKEEREAIIKYIFEEDRRLRRKEKGLD
jgi:c-di-GMP-binding flagellar brake protein YcgR